MGTPSTKKFLKQVGGQISEEAALLTSAGAADANKVPALGATGVLDLTIVNGVVDSAGAADAGKVAALDSSGRISNTILPVGLGPDTALITTSEALAAGDLVNIWESTGAKARKADPLAAGKEAHGFVLLSAASGAQATVYFEGTNTSVTGLVPGAQFLGTTAGKCTNTAPTASGSVVQRVGFAISATAMNFNASDPIVLA